MRVKEFRELFSGEEIRYFDVDGKDISYKPQIILDCMTVIGSEHNVNGTINVDCLYEEK